VGHAILRIAYHLLKDPTSVYEERGVPDAERRDQHAAERRLICCLQRLDYKVTLEPLGAT
jgi:hypothetical protein